jgi:hypothetical protein
MMPNHPPPDDLKNKPRLYHVGEDIIYRGTERGRIVANSAWMRKVGEPAQWMYVAELEGHTKLSHVAENNVKLAGMLYRYLDEDGCVIEFRYNVTQFADEGPEDFQFRMVYDGLNWIHHSTDWQNWSDVMPEDEPPAEVYNYFLPPAESSNLEPR